MIYIITLVILIRQVISLFKSVVFNYRSAWQKLGDLSKEEAMKEFFTSLETLCPTFKIYIEAHEREKEAQERKR